MEVAERYEEAEQEEERGERYGRKDVGENRFGVYFPIQIPTWKKKLIPQAPHQAHILNRSPVR